MIRFNKLDLILWWTTGSLLVIAISCSGGSFTAERQDQSAKTSARSGQPPSWIYVRYFYHTLRCPACEVIEILARKTVEQAFAEEIAAGRLKWDAVNMDLPENRAVQDKYHLRAPSVVVSAIQDNEEIRWKNLESVWDLYDNEADFQQYIRDEVDTFLKSLPPENNSG